MTSPVDRRALAAIPADVEVVQFCTPLSDADHHLLGEWFTRHPQTALRCYDAVALAPPGT